MGERVLIWSYRWHCSGVEGHLGTDLGLFLEHGCCCSCRVWFFLAIQSIRAENPHMLIMSIYLILNLLHNLTLSFTCSQSVQTLRE
jgi:hypothetical protein